MTLARVRLPKGSAIFGGASIMFWLAANSFLMTEEFRGGGELFLLQLALDLTESSLWFNKLCLCEPPMALLVVLLLF